MRFVSLPRTVTCFAVGLALIGTGCGDAQPPGDASVDATAHSAVPAPQNNQGTTTAAGSPSLPEPTTADLWEAAEQGHVDDVLIFIQRGADLAAHNAHGKTALQLALEKQHDDVAKLLLKHGAKLSIPEKDQQTPLIYLAKTGDLRLTKFLIENSEKADQTDDIERTPLVWAAEKGHVALVELLLDRGANPNHKSRGNWTALHVAARSGHSDVVDALLKRGADASAETSQHDVAVFLALQANHVETAERLLGPDGKVPPHSNSRRSWLAEAVTAGNVQRVQFLAKHSNELEKGVGEVSSTPLILAAESGKTEIVQALLDAGANINAATSSAWTALHYAVQKGYTETAQLLVNRGADVTAKNNLGKTPLQMNPEVQLKLAERK